MRVPKKRLSEQTGFTGEIKPSPLSLALIRQVAGCIHVEKGLHIPDNILFIN